MYRHSVSHHTNPFTAPAGKKVKEKIDYCARQIKLLAKWYAETGAKLFEREAEKWQQRIYLINKNKI